MKTERVIKTKYGTRRILMKNGKMVEYNYTTSRLQRPDRKIMRVPALAATDLDLGRSLRWCHNRGEKGMSWTRICMENSWARVAAIVLMLGLIMPESLRAGVVLEDGEIDSSTVEVGTFAVVIYGQGERQPVSGERESLTTARGYIQAVDAETLTLALEGDHGAKQIALNRIQTLVLIGLHSANKEQPSFPTSANRNNMQDDGEIESAADRVDNAGAVNNRGEEHFQSLTDSVHDASGFPSGAEYAFGENGQQGV